MDLKNILIVFLVLLYNLSFSQSSKHYDAFDADEFFTDQNYLKALPIYKDILKTDKKNVILQYKIAECYLNTNINKAEAIKYLEFCVTQPKVQADLWFKLGQAYLLANKIDDAIEAFVIYKGLVPRNAKVVERQIEICENAKTLIKNPINITFANLGSEINTEFPDYYPWITQDENLLAFTTRRKGTSATKVEIDGYFPSDVYLAKADGGKWNKAENAGNKINSTLDEEVVGLRADGSEMIIYMDHITEYGDIYTSTRKNGFFTRSVPFPEHINKMKENSANISPDGNTLLFVRCESVGEETDIFICRKLPNGNWSEPFRLGNEINTPYNEDFPYFSTDGTTIYFSSEGHNTMGGYDLFKTVWNPEENTWTPAENLGYPLNTTDNERSISFTADNRAGYISALRPGGMGDLDIYRIKFNDITQKLTIYLGNVSEGDSLNSPLDNVASIVATNKTTKEEFTFVPNRKTGKFVMVLPAGVYKIKVASEDYIDLFDELTVSDLGLSISEEKKNYILKKK